ncbi:MAG: hypothetical protein ACYTAN_10025 [Planctomycetota bacterium]
MNSRRILTVAFLFVLAILVIFVLNRLPFFTSGKPFPRVRIDVGEQGEYRAVFFNRETLEPMGELVARNYRTLDDGTIGAEQVSITLDGTKLGDVSLTSDRAEVSLKRSADGYTGRAHLFGDVVFEVLENGVKKMSGRFEDVTFDAGDNTFSISGPLRVSSIEKGLSLAGTDATGVSGEDGLQFAVKRHVRLEIAQAQTPESTADTPEATVSEAGESKMLIEAGGPLTFDSQTGVANFAGGVQATLDDGYVSGSALEVNLVRSEEGKQLPPEFEVSSINLTGPVEGHMRDVSLTGERLYWSPSSRTAGVVGQPALFASGEGFVESPSLEITLSEDAWVEAIKGSGAGSAFFPGRRKDETTTEPAPGSFSASWLEGILYEAAKGKLEVAGDVTVKGEEFTGRASKMAIGIAEQARGVLDSEEGGEWFKSIAENVTGFEASGPVTFSDGKVTVKGDRATYRRSDERVELTGRGATAEWENLLLSARRLVYEALSGNLSADRDCGIRIETPPEEDEGPPTVVNVKSKRIDAHLTEVDVQVECSGDVQIDWVDGRLTCARLLIEAETPPEAKTTQTPETVVDTQTPPEGETTQALEEARVKSIEGTGDVVFEGRNLICKCDSFSFDAKQELLVLLPPEESDVEVRFGDSATIWCRSVALSRKERTARCAHPQAVMWVSGSFAGFQESERSPGGVTPAGKSKIDLTAGSLVLTEVSEERATLRFDGGVNAERWDSRTTKPDQITCKSLSLETFQESDQEKAADFKEAKVVSAEAHGGVYLRYWGPKATLHGRGDEFTWDEESREGHLRGSPAVAWLEDPESSDIQNVEAGEFIYYFSERSVEIVRGREGVLIFDRSAAP